jgi:alpha-ribazole phosphatase
MSFVGLLRHGTVEGGKVYRGRTDVPLSPIGYVQMHEALIGLTQWDRIVSSPLQRCSVFAREFAHCHGIAFNLEPGLSEIDFGDWEGRSAAELMQTSPEALTEYWRDPSSHTPPGGESLRRFRHRVVETWEVLLRDNKGQRLLLVSHGGVIRMLLCYLQGWPLERILQIEVKHAALYGLLMAQASLSQLFTTRGSMLAWLEASREG